jgi:hypothetical protein
LSDTHYLSEARAENHASVLTAVIQNRTANAEFGLDEGSGEGRIANKLREEWNKLYWLGTAFANESDYNR